MIMLSSLRAGGIRKKKKKGSLNSLAGDGDQVRQRERWVKGAQGSVEIQSERPGVAVFTFVPQGAAWEL